MFRSPGKWHALVLGLAMGSTACANILDYDDVEFEARGSDTDATVLDGGDATLDTGDTGDAGLPETSADVVHDTSEEQADPCLGVDCGANGTCETQAGAAHCACAPGFHEEGLGCVEDTPPDPCDGVVCGANARCEDGACFCDDGFEGDPTAGCSEPNPLEDQVRRELVDIAMAELGKCEGEDEPYMLGQPGYWCYDFVAWVYSQSSYPLPSPLSLPSYETGSLPAGWRPEPGDLIKFNIQHYGMVADVSPDGSVITTVEGNVNSCVMSRSTTDASVEYYGSLDQAF